METPQNSSDSTKPGVKKTVKIIKWALVLAILIVLNLFINYSVSLVYKEPKFENFCPMEKFNKVYTSKDMCVADGGMWTESTAPIDIKSPTAPVTGQTITGYCNATYTCQQNYDDARSVYNRNVFIILVVLGVVVLALGAFLTASSVVSLGLSFGGVLSLIIGAARYWSDMHDIVRVIVLACALGALIWIGVRKIKE